MTLYQPQISHMLASLGLNPGLHGVISMFDQMNSFLVFTNFKQKFKLHAQES
jgi:hypothetical protein